MGWYLDAWGMAIQRPGCSASIGKYNVPERQDLSSCRQGEFGSTNVVWRAAVFCRFGASTHNCMCQQAFTVYPVSTWQDDIPVNLWVLEQVAVQMQKCLSLLS